MERALTKIISESLSLKEVALSSLIVNLHFFVKNLLKCLRGSFSSSWDSKGQESVINSNKIIFESTKGPWKAFFSMPWWNRIFVYIQTLTQVLPIYNFCLARDKLYKPKTKRRYFKPNNTNTNKNSHVYLPIYLGLYFLYYFLFSNLFIVANLYGLTERQIGFELFYWVKVGFADCLFYAHKMFQLYFPYW